MYDLYDLYDLARVAGWEPYNLPRSTAVAARVSSARSVHHTGPAQQLMAAGELLANSR